MIRIENLSVCYKTEYGTNQALQNINLVIDGNAPCAIIGPSGCGKSTLLKAVAGLVSYSGRITLNEKPIDNRKLSIGFVPQNYGLFPWKNVQENIFIGAQIKDKPLDMAEELLELLGLKGLEMRYPSELSGGQQQRVSLARAFLLQPDLLLMDEPFSALDIISREEMQELFILVWNKYKIPVLFVTHFVEEAVYLAQQIVVFSGNPGVIKKDFTNSLFAKKEMRSSHEFFMRTTELREILAGRRNADD